MHGILKHAGAIDVEGGSDKRGGTYLVGVVSKSYRLAETYRGDVHKFTIECPKLEARLDRAMTRASHGAMKGLARQWILQSYLSATFTDAGAGVLQNRKFKTQDAFHRTSNHYQSVLLRRLRFSVCKKSGRVYYPVSSLPRVIRAELLIDGAPTVEIDVSASQPTLLATLYPRECEEKVMYLQFVQGGSFYEDLARDAAESWTRDEAKTQFFNQIAYGSYYCANDYKMLPAFAARFPILSGIMAEVKRGGNSVLPISMQKIEASITVDGACLECAQRGIKVMPVHDSLICKKSDAKIVREIFARNWFRVTGILAQMKGGSEN